MEGLPEDALMGVLLRLDVADLCSAASCCQFLAAACSAQDLWRHVYCQSWPQRLEAESSVHVEPSCWRLAVKERYLAADARAAAICWQLQEAGSFEAKSVEVFEYKKCMETLKASGLSFADVRRFLLNGNHSVLLNLLALHYCIQHLTVQASHLAEALEAANIGQRIVCVRWWILGSWARSGYRQRDEMKIGTLKLADLVHPQIVEDLRPSQLTSSNSKEFAAMYRNDPRLVMDKWVAAAGHSNHLEGGLGSPHAATDNAGPGPHSAYIRRNAGSGAGPLTPESEKAVQLLQRIARGAIHEVMRVQISADFVSSAWVGRDMPSQR